MMKKHAKRIVAALCVLTMIVGSASIGITQTVSASTDGAADTNPSTKPPIVQTYTDAEPGVAPTENVPEGYLFSGWFQDENCTVPLVKEWTLATVDQMSGGKTGTGTTTSGEAPGEGVTYANMSLSSGAVFMVGQAIDTTPNFGEYTKEDLALAFWYYAETAGTMAGTQIELSSNAEDMDNNEMTWYPPLIPVQAGWNYIELPLDGSNVADTTYSCTDTFDLNNIETIRWFKTNDATSSFKVTDLKIVVIEPQDEWTLITVEENSNKTSTGVTTSGEAPGEGVTYANMSFASGTNYIAYKTFTALDFGNYTKSDLALTFWYYSDTAGTLPGGWGQIELASSTTDDVEEMYCQPRNITVQAGWNYIELPLTDAYFTDVASCDISNLVRIRWYKTGNACDFKITDLKITVLESSKVQKTTYAKFVDADILGVKAQISGNLIDLYTSNDASGSLRFITSVDTLKYQKIGFVLEKDSKKVTVGSNQVYKKLYAVEDTSTEMNTIEYLPSEEFSPESNYFKTFTLTGFSASQFGDVISATPYWITLDGTTVYGTSASKTITQGIEASSTEMILSCDTFDGATITSDSTIAVTNAEGEFTQGSGALKTTGAGQVRLKAILANPVDISKYQEGKLQFSLFIKDKSVITSEAIRLEIGSAATHNTEVLLWDVYLKDLENGWNTVTFELREGYQLGDSMDYKAVDFVRIYPWSQETNTDIVLCIDDIHVLKGENAGGNSFEFIDCDSTTGLTLGGNSPSVTNIENEYKEGTGAIKSAGSGVVWLSAKLQNPVDLSAYKEGGISFWIYISDPTLLNNNPTVDVELGSAGKSDTNEYQWTITELKSGWQKISLDFATATPVGGVDMNNINWFRIYGGITSELTVIVDNVCAEADEYNFCDYLSNGAVYQANQPLALWGTAIYDGKIKAELYNETTKVAEKTVSVVDGEWEITLPGQEGGYTPYSIKMYLNGAVVAEYTNILFGEVWLAAGQSNMQLAVQDSYEGSAQITSANDEYLRLFQAVAMPEGYGARTTPATDINGEWIIGNTQEVGSVSAVAYNFALGLREKLDVPVAVLETSMGSTPIEAWLSKEMVDTDAELKAAMEEYGVYETATEYTDLGAMYYSKIVPLSRASIAGVIWYQGEGNIGRASIYAEQLDLLKQKWGEEFGFENDSMPFIFTQLAPYYYEGDNDQMAMTEMMDQMSTFYKENETSVAMTTIYDISLRFEDAQNPAAIHPTVKKPVGERMALAALGLVYEQAEATAPILKSCEIEDGIAVLKFEHVGDGLKVYDDSIGVLGFALCDASGVWVNATAEIIDATTVHVYSDFVEEPVYVSYAYCDMNTDANLCASSGIPAAPFSTGGEGGLGSRSYLNCDSEVFVMSSSSVGDYKNLWTVTNRSENTFDSSNHVQGIAAVKSTYVAGDGEVLLGMDLSEAKAYNATSNFENIGQFSVKMKNADARQKVVRVALVNTDGTCVYTNAQILKGNADFEEVVFDLTKLYYQDCSAVENVADIRKDVCKIIFCIADSEAGTVWVDDIKLGSIGTVYDETIKVLNCDLNESATFSSDASWSITTTPGEYMQSSGAFKTSGAGQVRLKAILTNPVDISKYQEGKIQFSLYIKDKSVITSEAIRLEIGSAATTNKEVLLWDVYLKDLENGWNTVTFDLSEGYQLGGSMDYTAVDFVRIYLWSQETNTDIVFIVDNIHVTDAGKALLSCDTFDGATITSDSTIAVTNAEGEFTQGKGALKTTGAGQVRLKATLTNPVDISKYQEGKIQLSLYIEDKSVITSEAIRLEIGSAATTNKEVLLWDVYLKDLEDGWNTVTFELSEGYQLGGSMDYTAVDFVRIYFWSQETNTDIVFIVDDIRAVKR